MRFRLGLLIGFAGGYYLGAMAGHERYEQINRTFRRIQGSEAFDAVSGKAQAVVDLGVERAKDLVDAKLGNGKEGGADSYETDDDL